MKKRYSIGIFCLIVASLVAFLVVRHRATHQPQASVQRPLYIALGDSVAAGVGLQTDSDSSACDRTDESYPHQVARTNGYHLVSLACSGATIPVGLSDGQTVNKLLLSPQLTRLYEQSRPQLVTLTIGANDAMWTTYIAKCYTGECGTMQDTASAHKQLKIMSNNLDTLMKGYQDHYNGRPPRMVLTGYHQVFSASALQTCVDRTNVSDDEITWVRGLEDDLNSELQSVTSRYSFAAFVTPDFTGHELCTDTPRVQSVTDTEPYHPTEGGQTAYAEAILKAQQ